MVSQALDETVSCRDDVVITSSAQQSAVEKPPQPEFKSLSVRFLYSSDGKTVSFPPNSRVPVQFETDLFVGEALLLLRDDNDQIYHGRIFEGKKRNIEVQIQGQFKSKPVGDVYIGLEVSERMKIGLVAKGMCNMILNFIQRIIKVHYSFGDKDNVELPHIVFPLEKADKLVITREGEEPPLLGYTIEESAESVARRKSGGAAPVEWNVNDTYTVSYNSMYVDLPMWEVCNLPIMRNVDLGTFWGEADLRMVAYEICEGRDNALHRREDIRYLFCAQVKYLGDGGRSTDEESDDSAVVAEQSNSSLPWDKARASVSRSITSDNNLVRRESSINLVSTGQAEESTSDSEGYTSEDDTDNTSVYHDALDYIAPSTSIDDELAEIGINESTGEQIRSGTDKTVDPDRLCPGWVDMCDKMGRYTRVFAFALTPNQTMFRTSSDFCEQFGQCEVKIAGSPRLSRTEKMRRRIGASCAHMLQTSRVDVTIETFRTLGSSKYDENFLRRQEQIALVPAEQSPKSFVLTPRMEGFVARAVSERHWIEQWAKVTDSHISFYHPDRRKASFRICLGTVLEVRKLSPEEQPNFPSYHFLAIETLGRTIYLMQATAAQRDRWLDFLSEQLPGARDSEGSAVSSISCIYPVATDNPTQDFLHKSSVWSCKTRRILNCRKLAFNRLGPCSAFLGEYEPHPCEVAEALLGRALQLSEDPDEVELRTFLDGAADLKHVDVARLNEKERNVFFINVYHIMVMHAYLVIGAPRTGFQWISYFNMIAYQCSDDIFSLAELEHCIIRAKMNPPSQFLSKFVLPKSSYAFASRISDFRVNFALNCGSLSCPPCVPVYTVGDYDRQMDEATRLYLENSAQLSSSKKGLTLVLPTICQWYAADFGKGQPQDAVRMLMPYFPDKVKECLKDAFPENGQNSNGLVIKFLRYDFHCRYLTLHEFDASCLKK